MIPTFRWSRFGASLIALIAAVSLNPLRIANAYDWNLGYGADLTLGYDDNFRLSEVNEVETSSSAIGLFADLEGTTEISSIGLTFGANSTTYSDSSIDDSDSYRLSLASSRRGERLTGSLGVSFDSASTAETELLDTGVIEDGSRETVAVSPGLTYQLNELNSVSLGLSYRDVSYDTVSLIDYVDNSASLSWTHQFDETSSVSTNLRVERYDPVNADATDIESFYIGYNWRTSEATAYSLSLGYSDVERTNAPDSGGNYSFEINHATDERNTFMFTLSQGFQPSGRGEVLEQTSLAMQWGHGLSDRAQLTLSANAVSDDDRDYVSVQVGSNYSYTREIGLGASVRHRRESGDARDADSTSVFFTLSYRVI